MIACDSFFHNQARKPGSPIEALCGVGNLETTSVFQQIFELIFYPYTSLCSCCYGKRLESLGSRKIREDPKVAKLHFPCRGSL